MKFGLFLEFPRGDGMTEQEAFQESLEIILKAWTTESFSFEGEHFHCKDVCVSPKPFQTPYPPVHIGITSAETFPIIGRMGYPIIINPSRVFALPELAPHIQQYRQAWQEAGHQREPQVGLRMPIYVAETVERAYSDPRDSAMFSAQRLGQRVGSYANYGGTTGDWAAESQRILGMSYDDWLRDKVAFGTSETVAEKLRQLQEDLGLTHIIYEINFGNLLPYDLQLESMRRFNEEVIPQFK